MFTKEELEFLANVLNAPGFKIDVRQARFVGVLQDKIDQAVKSLEEPAA